MKLANATTILFTLNWGVNWSSYRAWDLVSLFSAVARSTDGFSADDWWDTGNPVMGELIENLNDLHEKNPSWAPCRFTGYPG